ncbi:MAG: M16 family metallopeptidase [Candidatus Kapaibacterium sp.]
MKNGLDFVVIEKHTAPVITLNTAYRVGSKDEIPGMTGFAHLFEHLMFEGTKNIKKGDFDKICSLAGGSNNAYTTYDYTSYHISLPSHQLELAMWLESDRMFNFEVTPEALENQISVVTEEIRQTVNDQPYGKWREELASNAFDRRTGYSWEVHGRIEDVENVTVEKAQDFFDKYYRPDNAVMVLAGYVDPDYAFAMAEKYFETDREYPELPVRPEFSEDYKNAGMKIETRDNVPMPAVFLAFHADGMLDDSTIAGDILSNILAHGRSSRLYESLVYKSEIASHAGAFLDKREYCSLFTLYAVANQPYTTCDQLTEALVDEINLLKDKGINASELEKSGNQLTTRLAHEIQYSSGLADMASYQTMFWDDPLRLYSVLDKYLKINKKEVTELARDIFSVDNCVRIDVIPRDE